MQKLYYSIREVSSIADEEQHILRYWEKEFEQLNPRKNRGGNRIYSEKDLELILRIKKLLRDERLSLKGAKARIAAEFDTEALVPALPGLSGLQQRQIPEIPRLFSGDGDMSGFSREECGKLRFLLTEMLDFLKNT